MKKSLLFAIAIFLTTQSFSQLYIKLKPSYNKALGGQILTTSSTLEYTPRLQELTESIGNIRGSLGQGLMGNVTVGYDYTPHFGMELGFSYLKGKSSQGDYTLRYPNSEESATTTFTGNLFSIDPTFIFSSKEREGIKTYTSLGFPINFISYDQHFIGKEAGSTRTAESKRKYKGSLKIGVSTKLGIIVRLNNSVKVFSEVGFTYLNFSPNESELTLYKIGGKDSLSTLNTSDVKTVYREDTTKDYNFDYTEGRWVEINNPKAPRVYRKFDVPFSYLSFSIGLKVNLFKKKNID